MMPFIKLWPNHKLIAGTLVKRSVEKNGKRKSIIGLLSINKLKIIKADQVHGSRIKIVSQNDSCSLVEKTDGLITKDKRVCLMIQTADCVPLFFYEPEAKIIGLAHAGWKGSLKNIAEKMVKNLVRMGADSDRILIHIGPHIKSNCYKVDRKLASSFVNKYGKSAVRRKNGVCFLSLEKVNVVQLEKMKIPPKNITSSDLCTYCEDKLFYSYRRKNMPKTEKEKTSSFIQML